MWNQITSRSWQILSSYSIEILNEKHRFLLDTLYTDWCFEWQHCVMYIKFGLIPILYPLAYCYCNASFVNGNCCFTAYTSEMALHFSCVNAEYLFNYVVDKKADALILFCYSYWNCLVFSDGDAKWNPLVTIQLCHPRFCLDVANHPHTPIFWFYVCLLGTHYEWTWLTFLHDSTGITCLPRHSDIANGSPMVYGCLPLSLLCVLYLHICLRMCDRQLVQSLDAHWCYSPLSKMGHVFGYVRDSWSLEGKQVGRFTNCLTVCWYGLHARPLRMFNHLGPCCGVLTKVTLLVPASVFNRSCVLPAGVGTFHVCADRKSVV